MSMRSSLPCLLLLSAEVLWDSVSRYGQALGSAALFPLIIVVFLVLVRFRQASQERSHLKKATRRLL